MSTSSSSEVRDGIGHFPVRPVAVVYCEGNFGKIDGKTANGLVRQSETYGIASVIDSTCRERDAGMVLDGVTNGILIVGDLDEALAHGNGNPGVFIVGLAPTSGLLSLEERNVILHAVARGLHIVSGLHDCGRWSSNSQQTAVCFSRPICEWSDPQIRCSLDGMR